MNTFSFSNKVAIMKNAFFCLCACCFSVCVPIKHSIRIEKRTKPLEYHPRLFFFLFAESQYNSRYQQWTRYTIPVPMVCLGGIQLLRHQRGGWVGWPNDDV